MIGFGIVAVVFLGMLAIAIYLNADLRSHRRDEPLEWIPDPDAKIDPTTGLRSGHWRGQ